MGVHDRPGAADAGVNELDARERALDALGLLHDEIDRLAGEIARRHGARVRCRRGCFDCCVDDLTVFEVEAEAIRRGAGAVLASRSPHPEGRCALLGADGECRIYDLRPAVCRTLGLPLRWLGERSPGRVVEYRDICPRNEPGPPLETLDPSACWSIGPFEERLAALDGEFAGKGAGRRVALRDLFVGR